MWTQCRKAFAGVVRESRAGREVVQRGMRGSGCQRAQPEGHHGAMIARCSRIAGRTTSHVRESTIMVGTGSARGYDPEPMESTAGFRLSWGAVFAGLVVAIALQLTLTLLGAAIGFSAWQPGESTGALGVGAAIWAIVSVLLSLFIGGRTTGRLAGILTRTDGILHGILLWALSTIVAVWLLASGAARSQAGPPAWWATCSALGRKRPAKWRVGPPPPGADGPPLRTWGRAPKVWFRPTGREQRAWPIPSVRGPPP